ncbi:pyridoxamine 5'-phosphate oxidase [Actinomadura sp. KC345]|uniref:pyridoxamine 5'-phosphate oxidase family protein n=1 Tax=Actinomadura sp. KC345 TaxID=2530371 RepID=UPI0010467460|nr:pyridoxamine 5'-phosphate oxidase family protein [Actinomadura sp. KC345]TDC55938.1 pyridoxamine 5'-phosphate oxidase [Actinomadura sp. KC345]
MGVRLTEEEAWSRLASAHTGILTTLRRDGRPVPLPVWFTALDRRCYLRTPAASAKVGRIRRDPRASLLIESGTRWVELAAVLLHGTASIVTDEAERAEALEALNAKYADHGPPSTRLPDAARAHYSSSAVIRFEPTEPPITWDNARLRLRDDHRPQREGRPDAA